MYPHTTSEMALQSMLFGHRLRQNQTKYEYLLEFLLVAISPKALQKSTYGDISFEEMFPIDSRIAQANLKYSPIIRMGLKRFIFMPSGKLEGKAIVDKEAYEDLLRELETKMDGRGNYKDHLFLLQSLLGGYAATEQNRSWFVQSMLPICPEVIFPEAMGSKKYRVDSIKKDSFSLDYDFDFKQRTYFCRGGEIYYLHLLQAMQENPEFQEPIEGQLSALLHAYPAFSTLSHYIQNTWEEYLSAQKQVKGSIAMDLSGIPDEFSVRGRHSLDELKNLLESNCHPFEKLELLSICLLIQIFRMMYQKAGTEEHSNYWVVDINSQDFENKEMKKFAQTNFAKNEELIKKHLYDGFEKYKENLKEKDEKTAIRNGYEDTVQVFRKMGKTLGMIIPLTGTGMRFTLSEDIVKFLVLALVPPGTMTTLDDFLDRMHTHFAMVIGPEEYRKEAKGSNQIAELSFLEENKRAFAEKMKNCGFLRDISDATAIIENPYEKKVLVHESTD